jgi:chitinase
MALGCSDNPFPASTNTGPLWVNAYYPSWSQEAYPPEQIDFSAITHIAHFAAVPHVDRATGIADGTLDAKQLGPERSASLTAAAHAAGRKALLCVGGANTANAFRLALQADSNKLVSSIVTMMQERGYDGVDVDWEPVSKDDSEMFGSFVGALRAALDQVSPRPLLTAAVMADSSQTLVVRAVVAHFDQINLMTYDMSNTWLGATWHNAPLFGGFGGNAVSIDQVVSAFTASNIPASKLGIGVPFYGYAWSGGVDPSGQPVMAPAESWSTAPEVDTPGFQEIMDKYYRPERYHWDDKAKVPYLSVPADPAVPGDKAKFISYDDQTSVAAKIDYARSKGLGGMILWSLGLDYFPDRAGGERAPLLEAVRAGTSE